MMCQIQKARTGFKQVQVMPILSEGITIKGPIEKVYQP